MAVALRSTALAAAVLAIALGGCGGGDSESSTSTPPPTATQASPSSEASRGGEASIEDFGSEAEGAEREGILAVFTGYLEALATKDYAASCSDLSTEVHESIAQLVGEEAGKTSCAAVLPALLSPAAPKIARQQSEGEVTRVRVEGDRAFVVFKAPGAELYQQTLVAEGGEWKVTTLAVAVLVPEL
jgi:hypothetical protein